MKKFTVYTRKANSEPVSGVTIVDLLPIGREDAISRSLLIAKCSEHGLINPDNSEEQKDREMRRLLEQARLDYTILNLSNWKGYYRPSSDDLLDLQRYIRQEEKRAKAVFKNIKKAKALYEDYKRGRIVEGGREAK